MDKERVNELKKKNGGDQFDLGTSNSGKETTEYHIPVPQKIRARFRPAGRTGLYLFSEAIALPRYRLGSRSIRTFRCQSQPQRNLRPR
jgi:hypothetical protein